jgi:hypothetical protein
VAADALVKDADVDALPLEEIQPVLHPSAACDLRRILFYVPTRLRPAIALTFAETSTMEWAQRAGLPRTNVMGWLNRSARMPFGGAIRLAKVFGVPAEELFEGWT